MMYAILIEYQFLIKYPDPSEIIGPFATKAKAESYAGGLANGISRDQVRSVRIVKMKAAVK